MESPTGKALNDCYEIGIATLDPLKPLCTPVLAEWTQSSPGQVYKRKAKVFFYLFQPSHIILQQHPFSLTLSEYDTFLQAVDTVDFRP